MIQWILPVKMSMVAVLLVALSISAFTAGYAGGELPDLTDRDPCEHQEHEPEELLELEDRLGATIDGDLEETVGGREECDPDDPQHERRDRIMELLQERIVLPWYQLGQIVAAR